MSRVMRLYQPEVVGSLFLAKTTTWHQADTLLLQQPHTIQHVWLLVFILWTHIHVCTCHCLHASKLWWCEVYGNQTLALTMAFWGRVMRGKVYMAPWTGLQVIPGTALKVSSVSLAFSAKAASTAVRSWRSKLLSNSMDTNKWSSLLILS